ncbi:MAG: hypothetical protein JO002_06480 [Burkholderiaceae bacterium]|nr:hypothetical protein [Burkholderiaceae bacterium]
MSKFLYILYGCAILIGSAAANINYATTNSSNGRGWISQGGGTSWGGAGGSTGGFSSGGSHK